VSAIHLADALKHSLTLAFAQGPARRYNATVLRRLAAAWLGDRGQFSRQWLARTCPICGYSGMLSAWENHLAGTRAVRNAQP
jgi:hypothetical protein